MFVFAFEESLLLRLSVSRRPKIWRILMYRVHGTWVCMLFGKGICSVILDPSFMKNIFFVARVWFWLTCLRFSRQMLNFVRLS